VTSACPGLSKGREHACGSGLGETVAGRPRRVPLARVALRSALTGVENGFDKQSGDEKRVLVSREDQWPLGVGLPDPDADAEPAVAEPAVAT